MSVRPTRRERIERKLRAGKSLAFELRRVIGKTVRGPGKRNRKPVLLPMDHKLGRIEAVRHRIVAWLAAEPVFPFRHVNRAFRQSVRDVDFGLRMLRQRRAVKNERRQMGMRLAGGMAFSNAKLSASLAGMRMCGLPPGPKVRAQAGEVDKALESFSAGTVRGVAASVLRSARKRPPKR